MKKLLFVNPGHFGTLTDTYFYCLNLKELYDVSYFGIFEEDNNLKFKGINIIHLNVSNNLFLKKIIFLLKLKKLLSKNEFDYVFVNYFLGCSLINLFRKNKINIDVRTSVINKNLIKSYLFNFILRVEVSCFSKITCISQSLTDYLKLPKRAHILPLGASELPLINKDFSTLKLLYVGTFREREIEKTIYGFSKFLSNHIDKSIASYTIIGFGSDLETKLIKDAILSHGMQNNIFLKGKIRYPELFDYFFESNIGISFIPIRECFDNQPPTKTFEYLLSGMFVLATGTKENKKVINTNNGLIISDSIDAISEGLEFIFHNRNKFNSTEIQSNSKKYSWEFIVKSNLHEYIKN